jgi:hypothetical protein
MRNPNHPSAGAPRPQGTAIPLVLVAVGRTRSPDSVHGFLNKSPQCGLLFRIGLTIRAPASPRAGLPMGGNRRRGALTGKHLLLVLLTFALGASCSRQSDQGAAGKPQTAAYRGLPEYKVLSNAEEFMGTSVSSSGAAPWEVFAFQLLLSSPWSDAAFKDLLERATLPGRLYALCGLYFTDPAAFRTAAEEYRKNQSEVDYCPIGCIVRLEEICKIMDDGIISGGWPKAFRDCHGRYGKATVQEEASGEERPLSYWIGLLDNPDPKKRQSAIGAMIALGPWARDAAVPLAARLWDDDPQLRVEAAAALCQIGVWASPALPLLRKKILAGTQKGDEVGELEGREISVPAVIHAVGCALRSIGNPAIPILAECLRSRDEDVRTVAAWQLSYLARREEEAVDAIASALDDKDSRVRITALKTLGDIGSRAAKCIPAIEKLLNDPASDVAGAAGDALRLIRVGDGDRAE